MKIRRDLPLKYYFNLHSEEGLYDKHSVLFDTIQYLIRTAELKQKTLDLNELKFSSKTLKYIFGEKINEETFKEDLVKKIRELISDSDLEIKGDSMALTKKGISNFYTLE